MRPHGVLALCTALTAACNGTTSTVDAATGVDAGRAESGVDAGLPDGAPVADLGVDAGATPMDAGGDAATHPDAAPTVDASIDADPGYPPGPYGNAVGDVIPNLSWEGYVDDAADAVATTKPYVTYSMDAVRRSGAAYALVHVSDFMDPGSRSSARDLTADGLTLVTDGAVVVEILETDTGGPVTRANLDSWVAAFSLPVTSVRDPDATPSATFTALGRREQAWIVDLRTMTIVEKYTGSITGTGTSAVGMAVPTLEGLLGH